jgi:hypothetical protein
MVGVDDTVREMRDKVPGENLHIAGEYDQIDAVFLEEFDLAALDFCFVRGRYLDLVKGDTVKIGQCAAARVIADNERNFAGELAGFVAIKQVGVAMEMLGNEDRHAGHGGGELDAPVHFQADSEVGELFPKGIDRKVIERPFDAHKEEAGLVVLVLVGVNDVGAVLVQDAGDRGDEAFAVWAGDEQNSGILHAKGCQTCIL